MSTDEYSEDMPDEMYMQHRTPSAASTSYPNIGSSSSCSLPMAGNLELGSMQAMSQSGQMAQMQDQSSMQQRQVSSMVQLEVAEWTDRIHRW